MSVPAYWTRGAAGSAAGLAAVLGSIQRIVHAVQVLSVEMLQEMLVMVWTRV